MDSKQGGFSFPPNSLVVELTRRLAIQSNLFPIKFRDKQIEKFKRILPYFLYHREDYDQVIGKYSTNLVTFGIIAQYLGYYELAFDLYRRAGKSAYEKHLRWLMKGSGSIDQLVEEVNPHEAYDLSRIFLKNKQFEDGKKFVLKYREFLRNIEEYLCAAKESFVIRDFERTLTDCLDFFEAWKEQHKSKYVQYDDESKKIYEDAKVIRGFARLSKKHGFTGYKKFFEIAGELFRFLHYTYNQARCAYESGEYEQALTFFKKTGCFGRALKLEKHIFNSTSEEIKELFIEGKFERSVLRARMHPYSEHNIKTKDLEEVIKSHLDKIKWAAKKLEKEKYLLRLMRKRFFLRSALDYALEKDYLQHARELESFFQQENVFNNKITPGVWNAYVANTTEEGFRDGSFFDSVGVRINSRVFRSYLIANRVRDEKESREKWDKPDGTLSFIDPSLGVEGLEAIKYLYRTGHSIFLFETFGNVFFVTDRKDEVDFETLGSLRTDAERQNLANAILVRAMKRTKRKLMQLGVFYETYLDDFGYQLQCSLRRVEDS